MSAPADCNCTDVLTIEKLQILHHLGTVVVSVVSDDVTFLMLWQLFAIFFQLLLHFFAVCNSSNFPPMSYAPAEIVHCLSSLSSFRHRHLEPGHGPPAVPPGA